MNEEQHYQLFKKRGSLLLKDTKVFVAMIPRIYKSKIYKKKGFGSIYECAAKIGGISHAVVDEVIRVEEKFKEMPKLKALMPKIGLSKLRRVAGIANKETEKQWAEKIQKMSKPALETHIRDIKNSMPGHSILATPEKLLFEKEFEHFQAKLDPQIILKLRIIKSKMRKGTTWNEVFSKLVDLHEPRPQKNPRPSNPKKRHLATAKRRELEGKCSIPGCNKPAKEIHHKKSWAKYRNHDELEPLCKPHHELEHQSDSTIDVKFRQYKFQFS